MNTKYRNSTEFLKHIAEVVRYDPDTGELFWAVDRNVNLIAGTKIDGRDKNGYVLFETKRMKILAHKAAWAIHFGEWPTTDIDHINGNRSDNRIENLRQVSRMTNLQNQRRSHADSASGILGVRVRHGKKRTTWYARIMADGKFCHLGSFWTQAEAESAYLDAKRKLHDGCTI